MKKLFAVFLLATCSPIVFAQDDFLKIMKEEINRNFAVLQQQPTPAYYLSYRVYEEETYHIQSSFGQIIYSSPTKNRMLHTMVRVGSHEMDNTREIKVDGIGGYYDDFSTINLVLDNNASALQTALWKRTDELYKNATKQYQNVLANVAVKVAAEDQSDDFSKETPEKYYEKPLNSKDVFPDAKLWEEKLKKFSKVFSENKDIIYTNCFFNITLLRKYFVDTEGAEIAENNLGYRISLSAQTIADDGMDLPLYKSYFVHDLKDLPSDEEIIADAQEMSQMLTALRVAPVAEAYSGPVLMTAEASGVFFHEIFGHRIEGARLKQETDAQTFKKKVGELVLPEDFTLYFDPQIKTYKGIPLSGNYVFDDEGVRGQKVTIVENGILKSFLMSRVPITGFNRSNGHGRGMIYYNPVTRQSNMIIESKNPKTEDELRKMLIEEAKRTNKEYGYLIDKVSGGFTMTSRYMPNAFNVIPLVVYRIYVDGRPDELVRGVDLVGTPLAMFSQISACGKNIDVFNGYCGAESGSVPVSSISPTLFVKMVETQKKSKSQNQPPILPKPGFSSDK
ncbi:MAG: TldD/PmbA family protein [Bacteroides sp.]|nr:TldD/PmbA family protein [Bacteroides sp.]